MDGTPTVAEFEIGRDEPQVLHWLGLPDLADGELLWFDLAAMEVGSEMPMPARPRKMRLEIAG